MRKNNSAPAAVTAGEDRKKRKKALTKLGILTVLAFIVWIFSTIAWFAMNDTVGANGMSVGVGEDSYELRFKGDNYGARSYTAGTPVNNVIPYTPSAVYGKLSNDDYAHNFVDIAPSNGSYNTDNQHTKVILRLNDSYPADPKNDTGLTPGSEGVIRFWVVPKKNGTFTAKFSFDLLGYTAVQSDTPPFDVTSLTKIPSSPPTFSDAGEPTQEHQSQIDAANAQIQAESYLKTHILFFNGTNSNNAWDFDTNTAFVSDDIFGDSGSFSVTFPNAVAGNEYEVRVKWVWPNTLKQMLFISGQGEAASVTQNSAVLAEIRQYACDNFTSLLNDVSDPTTMIANNAFNQSAATTNLEELSRGYNKADSEIGKNVNYMLVELIAE